MNILQNMIQILMKEMEKESAGEKKLKFFRLIQEAIKKAKNQKINILLVGGTGVGKSSTINALFGRYEAEVGVGQNPETTEIGNYNLENITIWDSPGLGDSSENDKVYANKIKTLLQRKNINNECIIDMVLVIIDGSSRQLESTYKLIKDILVSNIDKERIVIGINQIDKAVGKYWDNINHCPKSEIKEFIENKIKKPIKERIKKDTGIEFSIICYSAGEIDIISKIQEPGYNMAELLANIIIATPVKKRIGYTDRVNEDRKVFESNDNTNDSEHSIFKGVLETIVEIAGETLEKFDGALIEIGKEVLKLASKKVESFILNGAKFIKSLF
jgi:predicted GTPase